MARVLVFGSINLDVGIAVPRLPALGETLLGGAAVVAPGGKGANQAHAARRFGCEVALFGDDGLRAPALHGLTEAGVDLAGVHVLAGVSTGVACIAVTPDGGNAIVVAPGANRLARADWVPDAALQAARVLLLQMEVPAEQSLQLARRAAGTVVLSLAPAQPLSAADLAAVDWLVLNDTELAQLCAALQVEGASAPQRASRVAARCGVHVVVTLGAAGACLCTPDACVTSDALRGPVVDTTGAGDTFAGVFAAALAQGMAPERALRHGVVAASLACREPGAQAAQPRRAQVDNALKENP